MDEVKQQNSSALACEARPTAAAGTGPGGRPARGGCRSAWAGMPGLRPARILALSFCLCVCLSQACLPGRDGQSGKGCASSACGSVSPHSTGGGTAPPASSILDEYRPLVVGARMRYAIRSKAYGSGVVEEILSERCPVEGATAFRFRARHNYDGGRSGIEEQYLARLDSSLAVVARMTSLGVFGTYKPPMTVMAEPLSKGSSWAGLSLLSEVSADGKERGRVEVDWSGGVQGRETISVPAGKFEDCVVLRNSAAAGKFVTTEWLARGKGVVRREVRCNGERVVLQELILAYR